MKGDDIAERLESFAIRALEVAKALPRTVAGRHLARQLVRSATSPGANYEEARAAESRADFAHKLRIALKELRESRYWLRIIARLKIVPEESFENTLDEVEQLCKIIAQSILTASG